MQVSGAANLRKLRSYFRHCAGIDLRYRLWIEAFRRTATTHPPRIPISAK